MKEYRIRAHFREVYAPRSYKRMILQDLDEAKIVLEQAKEYYASYPYLIDVVIEEREVSEWREHASSK